MTVCGIWHAPTLKNAFAFLHTLDHMLEHNLSEPMLLLTSIALCKLKAKARAEPWPEPGPVLSQGLTLGLGWLYWEVHWCVKAN